MKKKVNIIGAGVAGLCAGSYLQMNGYETEIFELHTIPGGLCTAWDRMGYRFDGCIHWLMGATPKSKMYAAWNEVLDIQGLQFHFADDYFVFEDLDGKSITLYRNADKLEHELLEKAPEDKKTILELTSAVRKLSKLDFYSDKAPEIMNIADLISMVWKILPYFGLYRKWSKLSIEDYSNQFKNPLLRRAIHEGFVPEMSAIFFVYALSSMHNKTSGYPIGGSLNFARKLEERYLNLGGKIYYGKKVMRILTTGTASKSIITGLELENGFVSKADYIISAGDGYNTIFELLQGKFINQTIKNNYLKMKLFSSYIQVSFGVNRTFSHEPTLLSLVTENPLIIDPETKTDLIGVRIFNFDPTMAPAGKTTLVCTLGTFNHQYWVNLRNENYEAYRKEKNRIALSIIDILEKKYPGISSQIEVTDVCSPATVIRYTNNWKGSFEGWILTPELGLKQLDRQLPGLSNFYMIGQWTSPGGGLPAGLITGRQIAQILCKKDRKKFQTSKV